MALKKHALQRQAPSRLFEGSRKGKSFGRRILSQELNYDKVKNLIGVSDEDINSTGDVFISNEYKSNQGINSTKDLSVDWSNFGNHTFFNSAEAKFNTAFSKTQSFPFDGTRSEIEKYFDEMTGFEKYIYDIYPKSLGYLSFSDDVYITVQDKVGYILNTTNKNHGKAVLDPNTSSFSIEFWIKLDEVETANNQIICQKYGSNNSHFSLGIKETTSESNADFVFAMADTTGDVSGIEFSIDKGAWTHICISVDRELSEFDIIYIYINGVLIEQSSKSVAIGSINTEASNLVIGNGVDFDDQNGDTFVVGSTLVADLDEFRFWHKLKTKDLILEEKDIGIFSSDELKLRFSFNEPSGIDDSGYASLTSKERLILDGSGNSLHSYVLGSSFSPANKINSDTPLTKEYSYYSPILFSRFSTVQSLQTEWVSEARSYDISNPNLITKLVPVHYLKDLIKSDIVDETTNTVVLADEDNILQREKTVSNKVFQGLLYIIAEQFDSFKTSTDAFSSLDYVDHIEEDSIPDKFLSNYAKRQGIDLPQIFSKKTVADFFKRENSNWSSYGNLGDISLEKVRNKVWRSLLSELREIKNSRGTIHSIKALIRSIGVDPDTMFKFKEYGNGSYESSKISKFQKKDKINTLPVSYTSDQYIKTANMTYDQDEISIVCTFKLPEYVESAEKFFSIGRLYTEGGILFANILVKHSISDPSVICAIYQQPSGEVLELKIDNLITYDNKFWTFCLSFAKNKDFANLYEEFEDLLIANQELVTFRVSKFNGEDVEFNKSASDFIDSNDTQLWNANNFYFVAGKYTDTNVADGLYTSSEPEHYTQAIEGSKFGPIKAIKQYVGDTSYKNSFATNVYALGIKSTLSDLRFEEDENNKLIFDLNLKQDEISVDEDDNTLQLYDFSLLGSHGVYYGEDQELDSEYVFNLYNQVKPEEYLDLNKVRVKSLIFFDDETIIDSKDVGIAPIYESVITEDLFEDPRFAITLSISDAIDQDISKMFDTIDDIEDIIGKQSSMFDSEYKNLEELRKIYFKKVESSINLKLFYEFFDWFDNTLGKLIEKMIPYTTKFLGLEYVIESHSLERPKYRYHNYEQYIDDGTSPRRRENSRSSFSGISHRILKY